MPQQKLKIGALSSLMGYHLRRASGAFAADFSEAVAGLGMRQVLIGVLAIIDANPGINQGAIGVRLGIQRANMVALINELVERGLVRRDVASDDRRAFSLTITAAGDAAFAEALERIRRHEARMLANFSDAERAMLIELLARIEAKA
ncbi:MarR family winged helix-turn-helix transcriptional regulator [Sphingomonas koreensis]